MNTTQFRLNDKDAAHYISNAAALWVLGVGFYYFAHKASSPFTGGLCFWFSIFLLCDCLRQARVAARLDKNSNILAESSPEGITHYGSWLQPEFISWENIQGMRLIKGLQSETYYLDTKRESRNFFRYVFFGMPRYDLPVNALPKGKEGFLSSLSSIPAARHLVPERASEEVFQKAA